MPTRDGDCSRCKATGPENTRGIDGRGRYAREIRSRRSSSGSCVASSPVAIPNMTISPWAVNEHDQHIEKSWNTPTRIKADDAWVIEHERRMNVAPVPQPSSSRSQHNSVREPGTPKSRQRSSTHDFRKPSPHHSYEKIFEAFEVEEPEEIEPTPSRRGTLRLLPYECPEESESYRSRRISHDSDSSYNAGVTLSRSSHRKSRTVHTISDREDETRLAYRPRRQSRTESHRAYLPPSFELPPPSGPVVHGQWKSCRQAVYPPLHYPTNYPPTYPVY